MDPEEGEAAQVSPYLAGQVPVAVHEKALQDLGRAGIPDPAEGGQRPAHDLRVVVPKHRLQQTDGLRVRGPGQFAYDYFLYLPRAAEEFVQKADRPVLAQAQGSRLQAGGGTEPPRG